MFSLVACSEDIPPKGDHSAKQPAAPAMAESSAPPPAPAAAMTTSSDSEDAGSSAGSADRSIEVLMQDDGGNYTGRENETNMEFRSFLNTIRAFDES